MVKSVDSGLLQQLATPSSNPMGALLQGMDTSRDRRMQEQVFDLQRQRVQYEGQRIGLEREKLDMLKAEAVRNAQLLKQKQQAISDAGLTGLEAAAAAEDPLKFFELRDKKKEKSVSYQTVNGKREAIWTTKDGTIERQVLGPADGPEYMHETDAQGNITFLKRVGDSVTPIATVEGIGKPTVGRTEHDVDKVAARRRVEQTESLKIAQRDMEEAIVLLQETPHAAGIPGVAIEYGGKPLAQLPAWLGGNFIADWADTKKVSAVRTQLRTLLGSTVKLIDQSGRYTDRDIALAKEIQGATDWKTGAPEAIASLQQLSYVMKYRMLNPDGTPVYPEIYYRDEPPVGFIEKEVDSEGNILGEYQYLGHFKGPSHPRAWRQIK